MMSHLVQGDALCRPLLHHGPQQSLQAHRHVYLRWKLERVVLDLFVQRHHLWHFSGIGQGQAANETAPSALLSFVCFQGYIRSTDSIRYGWMDGCGILAEKSIIYVYWEHRGPQDRSRKLFFAKPRDTTHSENNLLERTTFHSVTVSADNISTGTCSAILSNRGGAHTKRRWSPSSPGTAERHDTWKMLKAHTSIFSKPG